MKTERLSGWLAILIATTAALVAIAFISEACAPVLTPAESAELQGVAAQIAYCQSLGRACKADGGVNCLDVYDRCMQDAGLRAGLPL